MSEQSNEGVVAFKGFDKDLKCRGFQYEIGATYEHKGPVVRCASGGFHSCEYPLNVFDYYAPADSRFAIVKASGQIDRDKDGDTKIASGRITIEVELTMPQFVTQAIEWITARCDPKKSNHTKSDRSASSATGYRSASSATGDQSASSATGYRSASSATGIAAVALNTGRHGKARAGEGGAIVLCNHDEDGNLRHIRASKVGENGIKPDVFYTLNDDGEFVEA